MVLSDPSEQSVEPKTEHAYRRGYIAGLSAGVALVASKLSPEESARIDQWAEGDLFAWSTENLNRAARPPKFSAVGIADAHRT